MCMEKGEEVKTAVKLLEGLIYLLEMHCNYICTSSNCIDCNIHYVRDKLTEIITLLNEE